MPKNYILVPVAILLLLINAPAFANKASATIAAPENVKKGEGGRVIVHMFWGELCANCEEEKHFLADLKRKHTYLDVREYEVLHSKQNLALLTDLMKSFDRQASGVPVTFIGDSVIEGFSKQTEQVIKRKINNCRAEPCRDQVALLQQKGQVRDTQRPVRLESATVKVGHEVAAPLLCRFSVRWICALNRSQCLLWSLLAWTASIPALFSYFCLCWVFWSTPTHEAKYSWWAASLSFSPDSSTFLLWPRGSICSW